MGRGSPEGKRREIGCAEEGGGKVGKEEEKGLRGW